MTELLTGKTQDHLVRFHKTEFFIHKDVLTPLENLFSTARAIRGFDLKIASSYRSFEAQKNIWNAKASGARPIYDDQGQVIDISKLNENEIMFAILRWSAVPGASRHHWGTDFDFYDASAMRGSYELKLVASEYLKRGIFEEAYLWLQANMKDFGFFQPYSVDQGGIAPEPWHLSYQPLADEFLKQYTFSVFEKHLAESDFALIQNLRKNAIEVYERFVLQK